MSILRDGFGIIIGLLALLAAGSAPAQESLDAGKTGSQLFASDCAICHKTPRGLAKSGGLLGIENFLSEHYTASRETARRIADYLRAVDQGVPAERQRAARPQGEERFKPRDKKAANGPQSRPSAAKPDVAKPAADGVDAGPQSSKDKAEENNMPASRYSASGPRAHAGSSDGRRDAAKPTEPRSATAKPDAAQPSESEPAKDGKPN